MYYKNFNQTAVSQNIQPLIDWGYYLAPQTGLANRTLHYAQGKTLGGSSGRNSNIFTRASVGWFQRVANHVGDSSWTWDGVLPYFKKSIQFTPPNQSKMGPGSNITYDASAYDSTGGPLHVTYSNYYQPMNSGLIKAFSSLGFKALQGLVSGSLLGYGFLGVTIDPTTQLKDSSETSFLWTALQNSTLTVYKRTYAKKILFDGNKMATGVQVETNGLTYTLGATKEVIVSAGVVRLALALHLRTPLTSTLIDSFASNAYGLWNWPVVNFAATRNSSLERSSSWTELAGELQRLVQHSVVSH